MNGKAYRIDAKVRNNRLLEAIERRFPGVSVPDAAVRLGVSYGTLVRLVALKYWPGCLHTGPRKCQCRGGWRAVARRLARALRLPESYLFDEVLYGRPAVPIRLEIDLLPALTGVGLHEQIALPDAVAEQADVMAAARQALEHLDRVHPRQAHVLRRRFGLIATPGTISNEETTAEIGDDMGCSRERVRQIEGSGLRWLRKRLRHYA